MNYVKKHANSMKLAVSIMLLLLLIGGCQMRLLNGSDELSSLRNGEPFYVDLPVGSAVSPADSNGVLVTNTQCVIMDRATYNDLRWCCDSAKGCADD